VKYVTTFSLVCAVFLGAATPADAGSLGDWFKKVGDSFAHPSKHQTSARGRTDKTKKSGESGESPTPTPQASAEPTIRTASVVNDGKSAKRDVPYGIPVADKPGFVTSPYAPQGGIVDVRGIPSGTEVKDPYTGKIFLRP
jgi:hypothetical protein